MPDKPGERPVIPHFRDVPACVAIETLADPGYIIRCMILDCMKQYLKDNGCEAEVIYLTHGMEVLLNQHIRVENINERKPLRECKKLLGLAIVFDQPDFKLA